MTTPLLNRSEVKHKLVEHAQDTKYYWKQFAPRVSEATLTRINAIVESEIRNIVSKLPSKGKTI